ncbi:MAG: mannose-6-phosphate isomerase, class I [Leptospiraceae bacterium]|nr:mannose-6-phosphate isomerase, class I [Leptospiraceae bacterium]
MQSERSKLPSVYRLECYVMNYEWGVSPANSLIQSLASQSDSIVNHGGEKPIAELWMGAHPKSAATIIDPRNHSLRLRLDQAITSEANHFLGRELTRAGIQHLPFLFKILEAQSPLSIQAHPDKKLAIELHRQNPEQYPDNNHKPELVIALSPVQALAGFRRPGQIFGFMQNIPEFASLCSKDSGLYEPYQAPRPELLSRQQKRNWIKHHYTNLMQSSPAEIQEAAESFLFRLQQTGLEQARLEDRLFAEFARQFGTADSGLFNIYFLNYIELKPGQALLLGANEPHAYLGGQMLECMASSDNVIRAGLTTKPKDIQTLVQILHYHFGPPPVINLHQHSDQENWRESYRNQVPDFVVEKIALNTSAVLPLAAPQRPGIYLVLEGGAELQVLDRQGELENQHYQWNSGSVFLVPGDLEQRGFALSLKKMDAHPRCILYHATVMNSFR